MTFYEINKKKVLEMKNTGIFLCMWRMKEKKNKNFWKEIRMSIWPEKLILSKSMG